MYRIATCFAGATLLLGACSTSTSAPTQQVATPNTTASAHETGDSQDVHWGYTGSDGPQYWGTLTPEFAECSVGKRQAPIEITSPKPVRRPSPKLEYRAQVATIKNNGHTVEATAGPGNTMTVDGTEYDLVRMHFHTPAENIIDEVRHPVELHFVHESADGDSAVLAVMLKEGAANPAWQPFIDDLDQPEGASTLSKLPWPDMVPRLTRSIRFDGSLTTPECTEGLAWNVAVTPVEVSAEQIAAFRAAYDGNSRPVQDLNGREVTVDAR